MKINRIEIKNLFGITQLDILTTEPVQLIAGANAAGKSSIQNAIRFAMVDQPCRVLLKKDRKKLIHEGQKKGKVNIFFDDDVASVELPKGKAMPIDDNALPFVLEPSTFAKLSADERRKFMFELMEVRINGAAIRDQLIKDGNSEDLVNSLMPMLRSGFPAAHEQAKDQARNAKADWKATTGETWGSDKAEDWEPEEVVFHEEALGIKSKDLANVDEHISKVNQELGEFKATATQAEAAEKRSEFLEKKLVNLVRFSKDVIKKEQEIEVQKGEVATAQANAGHAKEEDIIACPCCSAVLLMVNKTLQEYKGVPFTSEDNLALEQEENHLEVLERDLKSAIGMLEEVEAAKIEFNSIEIIDIDPNDKRQLDDKLEGLQDIRIDINSSVETLKQQKSDFETWHIKKDKAAEHHTAVLAFLNIADQFAPDGIPSQLLAKAVKPFNKRLKTSSDFTGWQLPRINSDFEIEADERPYCLLSESEKWRVDAMIAEAISHLSGLKLFMLDRMDVLDIPGRGTLVEWCLELAHLNQIDSALIFATLKAPIPGDKVLACHWVEEGTIKLMEKAA